MVQKACVEEVMEARLGRDKVEAKALKSHSYQVAIYVFWEEKIGN